VNGYNGVSFGDHRVLEGDRIHYRKSYGQALEKKCKCESKGTNIAVRESTSPLPEITCHMGSPGSGDFPAFTLAEADTQFSDPEGMRG